MRGFFAFLIACSLTFFSAVSCSGEKAQDTSSDSRAEASLSSGDTADSSDLQQSGSGAEVSQSSDQTSEVKIDSQNEDATDHKGSPVQESTEGSGGSSDDPQQSTADITGKWFVSSSGGLGIGIGLSSGIGSVFVDFSGQMYFSGDSFVVADTEIKDVIYDGSTLSVKVNGSDLMTLRRIGTANPDSRDGTYSLVSGTLYDSMAETIDQQLGISGEDADVFFGIEGDTFYMSFDNMFEYTVSGNMLTMRGNVRVLGADSANVSYAEFEINGSSMSFLTNDGELISLTRWGR